jgi:hypothetical protein
MGMKQALADELRVDRGPWVTEFGKNAHDWNIHGDDDEQEGGGSGLPGRDLIAAALRTFGDCWGDFDAETAAKAFNLPIALVEETRVGIGDHFEVDPNDVATNDLGDLIQALTGCRSHSAQSVALVARLTNQHPVRIVEAVGAHMWMFLEGDRDDFEKLYIEMDGE